MALPVKQININDSQWTKLRKDVFSDRYVLATMLSNGRKVPIKLRYRGGHTRTYPKKSFDMVHEGRTYHYNAEYDDPSLIRNALSFRFFEWIGVPSPRTKHCVLKWNGEDLGVYLEIEHVDRRFFYRRGIDVRSIHYAVNDDANFQLISPEGNAPKTSILAGYFTIMGAQAERLRLASFLRSIHRYKGHSLSDYLKRRLDIDGYLRWLAGAVFTGNYDGFEQNYAFHQLAQNGQFGITPWDYEGTWGRNCYGKLVDSDLVRVEGYNGLTDKLMGYREYRTWYAKILMEIMNKHFLWDKIEGEIHSMYGKLRPYVQMDTTRKWEYRDFLGEPDVMRDYVQERRAIIRQAVERLNKLRA